MCPDIPAHSNEQQSIQSEIPVAAAHSAMTAAGKTADQIDVVLMSYANLQRAYPAVFIEVQQQLGIEGFAFDMNVACSSATFAIQTAADMVGRVRPGRY